MISENNNPITQQIATKRRLVIVGAIGIAITSVAIIAWQTRRHFIAIQKAVNAAQIPLSNQKSNPINQQSIVLVESPINGEKVEDTVVNRHPLAVVIENHPEARPQRGISDASVVYEAIAEGGITRFLAVFGPKSSVKVGPVRSARTYFIDWLLEYDAFFAHVGGAAEALQLIREVGVKDLDQFGLGERAYKREPQDGKAIEHTMFTSTNKLWEAAKTIKQYDINANPTPPLGWKEDEVADQRPQKQTVIVPFSSDTYQVTWEYDHLANTYKRFLAGQPHVDGNTNKQLTAKTIIIQEVIRDNYTTDDGRNIWKMTTIGSGPAKIVQDGGVTEGTWKKTDQKSRTKFLNKEGNELKLNRGTMWIEIVPPGTSVTITREQPTSTQ